MSVSSKYHFIVDSRGRFRIVLSLPAIGQLFIFNKINLKLSHLALS